MQVIDARDQATFMLDLLEQSRPGTFHTVSPAPPFGFGDLLDAVAARVAPAGTTLEWIDDDTLLAAGVDDSALPLWEPTGVDWWAGACDPSRANAAGLAPRPLEQTIDSTLAWLRSAGGPPAGTGLTQQREQELLARS
jgi:2'-hydroxyisoflavone reductase